MTYMIRNIYGFKFNNRDTAQPAASATTGSASVANPSASGSSPGSPEFPTAINTFRTNRPRPIRLIGEPENRARNPESSSIARSARDGAAKSARPRNASCGETTAKRFQGHAARQSSQPYIRLPINGRRSSGIDPLCSIVRYEMQRVASSRYGAGNAAVGQAVRQREQDPQRSACGVSGGISRVV